MSRVLVVATSRKTRGGITSVVKAHETGEQWKKFHCVWIETHRDGPAWRKIAYFIWACIEYLFLLPFADIVHIHVGVGFSVIRKMFFAMIAKMLKKRIIIHFHPASKEHLRNPLYINKYRQLFDKSDLLIVLSPYWINVVNKTFPNRNYRMEYLLNPCPIVNRNFSHKENVILYAGSLIERKGYDRLLKAFANITNKYPDWRIDFAGDGNLKKAKKIQEELKISNSKVQYLGWVTSREKEIVFQRASVYCLPSRGEGFPMGILDAIAYGIPVVSTPVGGIGDFMQDGVHGLFYKDAYDIDSLTENLDKILSSPELRNRIQRQADMLVYGEFDVKNICFRLGCIYTKLLDSAK